MYKINREHERDYATDMGFYVSDRVALPDGRLAYIDEIILRNVNKWIEPNLVDNLTVVRIDDEYWLDSQLSRV